MMPPNTSARHTSLLQSPHSVLFPAHPAFILPRSQFDEFLKQELTGHHATTTAPSELISSDGTEYSTTLVSAPSSAGEVGQGLAALDVTDSVASDIVLIESTRNTEDLISISNEDASDQGLPENKMLTENNDVAYRSSTNPLVDLFSELEVVVSGPRLRELLTAAWEEDSLATLKIIFNARSIHIGKASRSVFYRCAGWLAQEHPLTLLANLEWLARPVIKKKVEEETEDNTAPDINNCVAHGYYKDLLNLLVLAVQGNLNVLADPHDVLNAPKERIKQERIWDANEAKIKRCEIQDARHSTATSMFTSDTFYRSLHITVARLFAFQLATDLASLRSADVGDRRHISLCAKWAPSHKLFHDKHTFVVSSIAEILHPQSEFPDVLDRQTYLLHAREAYRKDVSSLRKALDIVERDISAQTFSKINYSHVPSLAMNRYKTLFARKDHDHFKSYLVEVAQGRQSISGAVLLPSTLISSVRRNRRDGSAESDIDLQVTDGQWRTLVQRLRDAGTMSSSIAVCDVSGSMSRPLFRDETTPMDTSIGLSLLVAEVTAPPFGGQFITFSSDPQLQSIDVGSTLHENVSKMESADWGMSTDFVAVFEKLILPQAKLHKVKPQDMVKRIFVFSDMQFDQACCTSTGEPWSSSLERVEKEFSKYGYELPQLVFWNLAGGRAGYSSHPTKGDPIAPKPVTSSQDGTALVSGYSQGLLKVFLEKGHFDESEEAIEEEVFEESGADGVVLHKRKKVKMDPLIVVKKAISHEAYSVLSVID